MKNHIVLFIGPTAVGKSSLLDRALAEFPQLVDLITYTTRPMRANESEGHPYHFVTVEKFNELVGQAFFVEWAHVHGRMYGTPRDQIERAWQQNRVIVADVDVQGAKVLMAKYPSLVSIFLLPPSIDALRQRFTKRGVADEADLQRRLESAQREIAQASTFQHVIINDVFEETYSQIRKIIENLLKNQ